MKRPAAANKSPPADTAGSEEAAPKAKARKTRTKKPEGEDLEAATKSKQASAAKPKGRAPRQRIPKKDQDEEKKASAPDEKVPAAPKRVRKRTANQDDEVEGKGSKQSKRASSKATDQQDRPPVPTFNSCKIEAYWSRGAVALKVPIGLGKVEGEKGYNDTKITQVFYSCVKEATMAEHVNLLADMVSPLYHLINSFPLYFSLPLFLLRFQGRLLNHVDRMPIKPCVQSTPRQLWWKLSAPMIVRTSGHTFKS